MDPIYFILLFTIGVCLIAEPGSGLFFNHKKKSVISTTSKPTSTTTNETLNSKEYDKDSEETFSPNVTNDYKTQNCLQVAENLKLSAFLKHIKNSGLTEHLTGKDPMTIFAPSNNAFGIMDFRAKNLFGKDKEQVKTIMSYHLSKGKIIMTKDMKNEQLIDTLKGTAKIRINVYPNEKERNKTLIYTATGAKMGNPDIIGSNCVIHIVKNVVLKFPDANIFDTLSKISKFKTIYEEIKKHENIAKLLSGEAPYTIFAPIEQAFTKNSEKQSITSEDILKLHIVAGSYFTADFPNEPELLSLQGSKLPVKYHKSIIADMMMIYNSTLFETDIPATNGVIHAINKVMKL